MVDFGGDCQFGVGEMTAHESISPNLVRKYQSELSKASIIVLDGNPPIESIAEVFDVAAEFNIPGKFFFFFFIKRGSSQLSGLLKCKYKSLFVQNNMVHLNVSIKTKISTRLS